MLESEEGNLIAAQIAKRKAKDPRLAQILRDAEAGAFPPVSFSSVTEKKDHKEDL